MIYGEDLRLGIRALLGRPAESLLLAMAVALAVAASVVGITLAGTAETVSERWLSSIRFREIVVTTMASSRTMEAPARKESSGSVELNVEVLERARSATQAVRYAYLAERTWFVLSMVGDPSPQHEHVSGTKVTPEFFMARDLAAAAGSLFTPDDMTRGEPVMVVGSELGATLFEDGEALNRTVVANFRRYLIIGVLERSRTEADKQAFAPAGFLRENFQPSGDEVVGIIMSLGPDRSSLRFAVTDRTLLDEAHTQLASYFGAAYGDGVLHITDPRAEARAVVARYRRVVTVILFLVLAALLIATLNMSSIFASRALRRRRSAGLLKAMGAPGRRVFVVFSVEALVVGAIGSAAGVGLAVVLAGLIEPDFGVGGLAPGLILAGVAASWAIVAACSVLPAMAAARAPAAEAIRYE